MICTNMQLRILLLCLLEDMCKNSCSVSAGVPFVPYNTTESLKITQGTAAPAERPAPIANASVNTYSAVVFNCLDSEASSQNFNHLPAFMTFYTRHVLLVSYPSLTWVTQSPIQVRLLTVVAHLLFALHAFIFKTRFIIYKCHFSRTILTLEF